ncbi:MAG: T9SS type A sorting domain-containing protein [Bacteroidetes bacterium]|nr:T9SS type A sorting domain-containing protein [Bacteroidota bacterium]
MKMFCFWICCLIIVSFVFYDSHAQSGAWTKKADTPKGSGSTSEVNGKNYVIGGSRLSEIYDTLFHTDIAAGNVSGMWTAAKSPYYINGEITIPNDSTLTIEPGVEVIFKGHYIFYVKGRLLAFGTNADTIRFTAADKQTGWHGIRFLNTPKTNDTSKFVYCSFKYGKANTGEYSSGYRRGGAILIQEFDKVLISNSLFQFNMNDGDISPTGGAAIYVTNANPIIKNSTFINNTGTTDGAIICWYSNAVISNNIFSNNSSPHGPVSCCFGSVTVSGNIIANNVTNRAGGGVFCMTSHTIITNNIITFNRSFGREGEGGGIKCWLNDKSIIINNTIAYNSAAHGGGVCCNNNSNPIFFNNIIWGNTSSDGPQVSLSDTQSDPHFLYNDIQGRKDAFGGNGAGSKYSGVYENNIDLNPLFKDTASGNYSLSSPSHCIGAGWDSVEVNEAWYTTPKFCIGGNPRPSPSGTRPDIGACESLLGSPVTGVIQQLTKQIEFTLYQNYPNPFNPTTTLSFVIGHSSFVTLIVYDILGREVATLVNEEKRAGTYEATWNAEGLSSGVYFYQLKTGNYVETKKMILLR